MQATCQIQLCFLKMTIKLNKNEHWRGYSERHLFKFLLHV